MFQDVIFDFEACAKNFFLYKIAASANNKSDNDSSSLSYNFGYNVNEFVNNKTRHIRDENKKNKITQKKKEEEETQQQKCSNSKQQSNDHYDEFEKVESQCNFLVSFSVYFTWFILTVFAYIREFLRYYGFEQNKAACERLEMRDFAPLFNSFEAVYARNCYMRVRDVFERPICGVPGGTVKLLDRETDDFCWNFRFPGTKTQVINTASYNYLGFAENKGECAIASAKVIDDQGISLCTSIRELGQPVAHTELESLVAEFIGVESAICFGMGFATNSMNLACLMDKREKGGVRVRTRVANFYYFRGLPVRTRVAPKKALNSSKNVKDSLIISDQYNHASLILGSRISQATIKIFKHNNISSLEKVLRQSIAFGNLKNNGKSFKKIIVIVEGIYSMEGTIYEAHSIGAMGKTGRGIVEYWGCNTKDVDIYMGTFTKSFGSAGGYIAGSKELIYHIRQNSPGEFYTIPISPPVAKQIFTSMSSIMGKGWNK
ncbi:Aminotran_1_2 domain-containing protein [Meloidogyne graminicola]|uniref:serine C-palmitoyltransferase n=1 Tax=Meloidogyne graminicola TaxID=189291 RepID=A0A8S9ZPX5_9BILA|nr:Aminotran_1_2 domain-containing protein [Meloidogyne graminicola]